MSSDPSLLEFLKYDIKMVRNYQPIVIKMLLESKNYITNIPEIKNKFQELNFDRGNFNGPGERPLGHTAIDSVKKVFSDGKLISFPEGTSKGDVKLIDNKINESEIKECLKICGEKILQHHVDDLMKKENQCYFIRPGKNGEFWKEFRTNNFVAVDYLDQDNPESTGDFDLSGLTKDEISKRKGNTDDDTELFNISQIKKGDIVAIVNDLKTIEEFAIATSDYYFKNSVNKNKHSVNVEYLNFGTSEIGNGVRKGIMKDTQNKIKDFLTDDNSEYFLLRHNSKGPWKDDSGKKYHLGRDSDGRMGKRVRSILDAGVGTKTIWYSTSKDEFYFWGYGTVTGIEEIKKDSEWYLTYNDFKFFDGDTNIQGRKLTRATASVNQQLQDLQNDKKWKFNWQLAINPISKKLYQQIIGEDLTSEEVEIDTVNVDNYVQTLKWKPNLILYGPPGTGKTFHAKEIAKVIQKENKFPDFFMLKGPWSNWEPNLSGDNPSWATTDVQSNLSQYNLMKVGDYVILQNSGSDLGPYDEVGYFGIGKITKLFDSTEPFFADEIEAGKIIWKKRLEFELIRKVGRQQIIPRKDGLPATKGLSRIADVDNVEKLVKEIESEWGVILRTRLVTFHPSYSYEDFVEGIRPETKNNNVVYNLNDGIFKKICNEAIIDPNNDYVLIIDEVNRGNISKIFGELITLIERDKREKLSLNLAYSQKGFTIPKNLYVIGTMNTADKSLIQIDTALRRRFAFMELMPNYDLDQINRTIGKVNLGKLLRTLNDKIRKENLRDKQIGHSYFMEIENTSNLQQVFKYEIIPLLQDYFYEDYNLLEKILGKNIISKNKMEINDKVVDFPDKLETELEKISDGAIETTNNSTDSDNSGQ